MHYCSLTSWIWMGNSVISQQKRSQRAFERALSVLTVREHSLKQTCFEKTTKRLMVGNPVPCLSALLSDNSTQQGRKLKNWVLLFFQIFSIQWSIPLRDPYAWALCDWDGIWWLCNVSNCLQWTALPRTSIPISFGFVLSLARAMQELWKVRVKL